MAGSRKKTVTAGKNFTVGLLLERKKKWETECRPRCGLAMGGIAGL
jgi:hypothetical protein